ncbi:MAG: von Willebrand factor type A domain-containing protein [Rhodobacteraceae bacterium]|jgi:Ca-activated chloride channel family protein|nr:von Willebrand factor type A domain-containing protein [Paracoccaceae bacterium]
MTDDLDRLKAALKAAEPAPDPARKAEALARAMAEFDRVQGMADVRRPMSSRPEGAGFWTGVTAMFSKLTSRAALAGTASVAVVGLGVILIAPYGQRPDAPPALKIDEAATAPATVPATPPAPQETAVAVGPAAEGTAGGAAPAEAAGQAAVTAAAPDTAPEAVADQASRSLAASDGSADSSAGMLLAEEPMVAEQEAPAAEYSAAPPAGALTRAVPGRSRVATEAAPGILPMAAPPPVADTLAMPLPAPDTEAFPEADRNPLKITAEEPVSTFSVDVDTASYAVVRSSLNAGYLPPPEAVRIEEMVNYFPYAWPAPGEGEGPFRTTVSVAETPWNPGTRLVTLALKGRMPAVEDRPPLNLVFLVDTSGSMQDANKLPLLKQSLRLMLPELRPEDQVAIVAYAGSAGVMLAPTAATEREAISAALDRLEAGGSTAGQEGLALAYTVARKMAGEGEVTRVLLATDGDFNVGVSDPEELKRYVERERQSGTYLSVLGFGRGNLDDATMQALAQNGNGTAAYIDTLNEARKVLVDELSGALFPIANDVKVQIEWNPATVAEYRLIGYETRALAREDFSNDRVDAGEIGAGHTVTAIYEITPVGSPARATEPLRYGASAEAPEPAETAPAGFADELGFLRLRYKEPGSATSTLVQTPIITEGPDGGAEARFAAAIAGFGQLLTDAPMLGDWGWDEAIRLASENRGEDPFGYRAEAVNLMRLAQSLSR